MIMQQKELFEFIKVLYNNKRIHSYINYKTPNEDVIRN